MAPPVGRFWGSPCGPQKGSAFFFLVRGGEPKAAPILDVFSAPKAIAIWQRFRFLVEQVPPGRPVLRLNLDETSIRFWYEPRLGLRRPSRHVPKAGFARQASRSQLRKAFSHIGIICDDASLQPHLPQVLLVNERTVTAEQHRRWTPLPGCNAQMWRCKSACINDKVFARVVRTLGKVLRERAADRQPILLLDAHVCHFPQPHWRRSAIMAYGP